jgi:hypothetical protein
VSSGTDAAFASGHWGGTTSVSSGTDAAFASGHWGGTTSVSSGTDAVDSLLGIGEERPPCRPVPLRERLT